MIPSKTLMHTALMLSVRCPQVRFNGKDDPAFIEKALAPEEVRALMANANNPDAYLTSPDKAQSQLQQAQAKIKDGKKGFYRKLLAFFLSPQSAFLFTTGFTGISTYQATATHPTTVVKTDSGTQVKQVIEKPNKFQVLWGLSALVTSAFAIGSLAAVFDPRIDKRRFPGVREILRELTKLRETIQEAKKMKRLDLQIQSETNIVKQKCIRVIEKQNHKHCEAMADTMRKAYRQSTTLKDAFDSIFGNESNLPTAQNLYDLFRMYAAQSVIHDKALGKTQNRVIQELELAKRQYVLQVLGEQTGQLFNLMEKPTASGSPLRPKAEIYQFLATQVPALDHQVDRFIEKYDTLKSKLSETDRYINVARQKLIESALKKADDPEVKELEDLIEKVLKHKQKIQTGLQDENHLSLSDSSQIDTFNTEVQELMLHLKIYLAVNETEARGEDVLATLKKNATDASTITVLITQGRLHQNPE